MRIIVINLGESIQVVCPLVLSVNMWHAFDILKYCNSDNIAEIVVKLSDLLVKKNDKMWFFSKEHTNGNSWSMIRQDRSIIPE